MPVLGDPQEGQNGVLSSGSEGKGFFFCKSILGGSGLLSSVNWVPEGAVLAVNDSKSVAVYIM